MKAGISAKDGGLQLAGRVVAHLCIDMQKMFAEKTEWHTPWMDRVLPVTLRIAKAHAGETIFTRFIPPAHAGDVPGSWRTYFERWEEFTMDRIAPDMIELVDPLAALVPPAAVIDKPAFSPFHGTDLDARLKRLGVDTLVITGAETDVCVLSAVMSAVDHGYFVVLPKDALCSSADETHDALMTLYASRFSQQVFLTEAEDVLAKWPVTPAEGPRAAPSAMPRPGRPTEHASRRAG